MRRFISISGPHKGTLAAYALPLAGLHDMRPGSALIRDLEGDRDAFGSVEVHCLYTPYDLMIVPATSVRGFLVRARTVPTVTVRSVSAPNSIVHGKAATSVLPLRKRRSLFRPHAEEHRSAGLARRHSHAQCALRCVSKHGPAPDAPVAALALRDGRTRVVDGAV